MTAREPRIAVLGGGLLGVCTALELARRGRRVTLIEGAADMLQGASRWNEGKIHLGFLYAADSSLRTAKRIIPGALAFQTLLERLTGRRLRDFVTEKDDLVLIHRDSVVQVQAFDAYASRVIDLIREAAAKPGALPYLVDLTHAQVRALAPAELADVTRSREIVAGYRVPERSVSTVPVADLLRAALMDEPLVEVHTNTWVTGLRRRADNRFEIVTRNVLALADGPFDFVVNALWEGRPAIDATLGVTPPAPWSHRFRAALFARDPGAAFESAVICTGPFGDVKRYADGRVYLSWYPAGLLAEGYEIEPPREAAVLTPERRDAVLTGTLDALSQFFPGVRELAERAEGLQVQGGWVYAVGRGSLADPASTLHRRDRFAITAQPGYISIDTAKYSIAPWFAAQIAERMST